MARRRRSNKCPRCPQCPNKEACREQAFEHSVLALIDLVEALRTPGDLSMYTGMDPGRANEIFRTAEKARWLA